MCIVEKHTSGSEWVMTFIHTNSYIIIKYLLSLSTCSWKSHFRSNDNLVILLARDAHHLIYCQFFRHNEHQKRSPHLIFSHELCYGALVVCRNKLEILNYSCAVQIHRTISIDRGKWKFVKMIISPTVKLAFTSFVFFRFLSNKLKATWSTWLRVQISASLLACNQSLLLTTIDWTWIVGF